MRALPTLMSSLVLAGCGIAADAQDGGHRDQRRFDVPAFHSVSLAGGWNVLVSVGPATSVRAEGDAQVLDRMEVVVKNGELHIRPKKNRSWSIGWRRDRGPVTVHVTTPRLDAASIGGSGDMRIGQVERRSFDASIGGSGDLRIARMQVGEASFSVAGSGDIAAAGSADKADVSVAGSGNVDVSALEARTASVSIVGSGDVRARAMETANISIMGSGDVVMSGSARCSVTKMGSGEVRCRG